MKFILARAEGAGWKAYTPEENIPEGAELKEVDTKKLLAKPKDWGMVEFCEAILRRYYRHVVTSNDQDISDVAFHLGNRAYNDQVNTDAESIKEDILSGEIKDRDDLYERVSSECESAVMYTRSAHEVLLYTDNFDHGFDEGLISTEHSRSERNRPDMVTQIAHWAYYADLMERLQNMEGIDVNEDNLGRCKTCNGDGYVTDRYNVTHQCKECEKYDSRTAAVQAAVNAGDVKLCNVCNNMSYTHSLKDNMPIACTQCSDITDDEAAILARDEDGLELATPEENDA